MSDQLTPHFSMEELTRSDTARSLGDANLPTPEHREHLQHTAAHMEEVRALFERMIQVTSGYRNPRVNAAVGGVPDSDHAQGWAVDFHVEGVDDLDAAKVIRDSGIKFDQLILERGRCVHISFAPRMRQQVMRQPGGAGSQCFFGLE